MRNFVHWLFSENNSTLKIGLFDIWHFLYLFIIFGGFILLTFLFLNKSEKARSRVVKIFALLTIGLYVADFLIMPLSDSYSGISVYKLPFNICTIMAVLVPFAEFNRFFKRIKPVIVTLSIASSLMWMCYPGTALGGQPPFSYIIFQTFMYHGFLFTWGALNLSLKLVTMKISKIWKEFIGIMCILVWAWFGNTIYDGEQNWFFIESSIFPFLPDKIMPFAVVFSVFGVCLIVYGVYYLVKLIYSAITKRKLNNSTSN
ncbi:MAG: YwaF family protein [Clostridia bacterium]|nr:YwaF family protein [Clostridia bacterium]